MSVNICWKSILILYILLTLLKSIYVFLQTEVLGSLREMASFKKWLFLINLWRAGHLHLVHIRWTQGISLGSLQNTPQTQRFSTVISWLVKLCQKKVKVFQLSILQTSITLCYFVGDDILKSHLMYNKRWAFVPKQSTSGLTRYINDLTLAANKLLGIRAYSPYCHL